MKKIINNRYINYIIKFLIIIALFFILYQQIFDNTDFKAAINHFNTSFQENYYYIVIVFVLMIINWGLETIKWKSLIDKFHFISWIDAIEGILFGISFSLFTPSRIGEFGGRIFALQEERLQAIVSTLLGSAAQIVVNISIGSVGFLAYLYFFVGLNSTILLALTFIVIALIVLAHLCLYNIAYLVDKFPKIEKLKEFRKYIEVIKLYSTKDMLKIEILSALRYSVYVLQFILLIYLFGINVGIARVLILVITMFFLQTINPFSIALIDFGFRGNVALFLFSNLGISNLDILAATIILWFINLIIPAIFGGISALRFKFIKEE